MMDTLRLEKIKIGVLQELSKELLETRVNFYQDSLPNMVVMQVRGYLFGRTSDTETVKYPADWWQAFKARWFPASLLSRFPVRYTVHEFSVSKVLPDLKLPTLGREVHLPIYHNQYEWTGAEREDDIYRSSPPLSASAAPPA